MQRIKKETFYDDLIYIMGQGNSEKMDYIRKRLSVISFMDCDLIESNGAKAFFGYRYCEGQGYIQIIGLVSHEQGAVIHEAIHAQDEEDSTLVEGATAVSTFRLGYNDEIHIKDFAEIEYSKVAILVNQIEKIYGINSLSTIGTDKTMKQFISDCFRLYKSTLLGIYVELCAERIESLENQLIKSPKAENLANASTEIVFRVQNLLLKMFINQELKQLNNVEDAKNMLGKLQSIGEARITGEEFKKIYCRAPEYSPIYRKFLQESDPFFEKNYRNVYLAAVKKFGEEELEPYSYENYKYWKENSVLLFDLDFGERQVFKHNGKYILRTPIKEDGRIVGRQAEEISANKYQELEEEYLLSRYISSMSRIADVNYHISSEDSLILKSGKYFLYKGVNLSRPVNIRAQKPQFIKREKAIPMIDAYYEKLSKESKYDYLKQAINRLIGKDWSSIEFEDSHYLIEHENTEQKNQNKKYYICGFDDGLKYDAKPVMKEVSPEKANQILMGYYDKHPIECFNRYAKLEKQYDNGISLYDFGGKHFLKRDNWVSLDYDNSPTDSSFYDVFFTIELTPQDNKELSECTEEVDKKLKMLKIMMRESLKTTLDFVAKANEDATNADWIKLAKLAVSSDEFDVYDYNGVFYYVGKSDDVDNITAITYRISEEMVNEILAKNATKETKSGVDEGEQVQS